jgi:aryl-alcohol dehydrogenase
MQTRAAVLRGHDRPFAIEDVELADPRPGEVLVRVAAVGMCHTDLTVRERARPDEILPAILGHEGAGVVERVGDGVTRVHPGDHVLLSVDSCGGCRQCHAGEPAYCAEFRERNLSGLRTDGSTGAAAGDGSPIASRWFAQASFAAHAVATERNAVVIDPSLPLELLGPLGCGVQTGAAAVLLGLGVRAGDSVAVYGAGAVGLSAVMAAKLAGASPIIAVDLHANRRELARELGATHAFDGADPDLPAQITAATGGVDHALDTTAVPSVIMTAIATLTMRGSCAMVGAGTAPITFPPPLLSGRTITYLLEGGAVPHVFIPRLIDHWRRGDLPLDRLTRQYDLTAINDAERDSVNGDTIKPILIP